MIKVEPTPCDIHLYDSDEYNDCIKDIVYEAAQDEWIMLDPRFPNLKGITPKRIDEFLKNTEEENMREYFEDYLQHIMVYDRDDIVSMCYDLGQQIEKKYPGKLHSKNSIFVTTPRGGHEVLSIFAYTNNLKKEQIPSHIRNINKQEQRIIKRASKHEQPGFGIAFVYGITSEIETEQDIKEAHEHIQEGNLPIIPDIWLETQTNYFRNKIETVFIIDDIIASGEQMHQAMKKIMGFFRTHETNINIIPIVLMKRKDVEKEYGILENTIYNTKTVGTQQWDIVRRRVLEPEKLVRELSVKEQKQSKKIYDSLITVRFPWGSPDGESDKILTTLYESRKGLERIERKQRRCAIDPKKCELK